MVIFFIFFLNFYFFNLIFQMEKQQNEKMFEIHFLYCKQLKTIMENFSKATSVKNDKNDNLVIQILT